MLGLELQEPLLLHNRLMCMSGNTCKAGEIDAVLTSGLVTRKHHPIVVGLSCLQSVGGTMTEYMYQWFIFKNTKQKYLQFVTIAI